MHAFRLAGTGAAALVHAHAPRVLLRQAVRRRQDTDAGMCMCASWLWNGGPFQWLPGHAWRFAGCCLTGSSRVRRLHRLLGESWRGAHRGDRTGALVEGTRPPRVDAGAPSTSVPTQSLHCATAYPSKHTAIYYACHTLSTRHFVAHGRKHRQGYDARHEEQRDGQTCHPRPRLAALYVPP